MKYKSPTCTVRLPLTGTLKSPWCLHLDKEVNNNSQYKVNELKYTLHYFDTIYR
ncbi:hypothetical protein Sjap_019386 [Stephania japonica]|uniref:Uncharacterized protein n=1 Tax=Stephania japonica TaxID=461633 RepID=A0AAP0HY40_9MAGN